MTRILRALAFITVLMLCACATPATKVRVDQDTSANLSRCTTFGWAAPSGEAPASFADQRVREAAMQTLKAKGYAEANENPTCKVSYLLSSSSEDRRSGPSVGVGAGGGSGGIGGGIGVSVPIGGKKHGGTMTIDIIDATRNAQIWSGSLDASFRAPELTPEEAKEVVEKILEKFPDRGNANK